MLFGEINYFQHKRWCFKTRHGVKRREMQALQLSYLPNIPFLVVMAKRSPDKRGYVVITYTSLKIPTYLNFHIADSGSKLKYIAWYSMIAITHLYTEAQFTTHCIVKASSPYFDLAMIYALELHVNLILLLQTLVSVYATNLASLATHLTNTQSRHAFPCVQLLHSCIRT